jgi:hypothetical protein
VKRLFHWLRCWPGPTRPFGLFLETQETTMEAVETVRQPATIGRVVTYRSRTGDYDVPAIVNCTVDTLNEKGVEAYRESAGKRGVPPLSTANHVHLTVLTPGMPGQRADAEDFKVAGVAVSENVAGCYQEWDIPFWQPAEHDPENDAPMPGSWRWPQRV